MTTNNNNTKGIETTMNDAELLRIEGAIVGHKFAVLATDPHTGRRYVRLHTSYRRNAEAMAAGFDARVEQAIAYQRTSRGWRKLATKGKPGGAVMMLVLALAMSIGASACSDEPSEVGPATRTREVATLHGDDLSDPTVTIPAASPADVPTAAETVALVRLSAALHRARELHLAARRAP